ncbi:MAG: transglycosylase SLT domain-containing protein [Rubrivivax sp.]|nr:transglycosylase SLT domain-containing protein [Rubrivivax sp.]
MRTGSALALVLLATGCATVAEPEPPPPAPVLATPVALPEAAAPAPAVPPEAAPVQTEGPPAEVPPRGRIDLYEGGDHSDLWARVREGFAVPDLDDDLVRKWEQWYAREPAYVQRMVERGSRYLFHIVEEIERREMPTELALLPFIESAFNPEAMSRVAASGMWQFMPATGRHFELRQNVFRDDRRSVLASTRAALDYLEMLHGMFGDWHLALAAYNWGQGNVARAIERNRRAGKPTDYASLRMPRETREYVPKLQAVKNIVLRPEAFALELPPLENHPFFVTVPVERDIDVALAARLAEVSLDEFRQLNPQLNKPVILAAGTPELLLPFDAANRFIKAVATHAGRFASWTAWVAPRTLKPQEAAKLTGMNEAELREVNRIPPRTLVKAGSTLLVPRADHHAQDVTEHIADNAALSLAPEFKPVAAKARRGKAAGTRQAAPVRGRPVASARAPSKSAAARKPAPAVKTARPAPGPRVAQR